MAGFIQNFANAVKAFKGVPVYNSPDNSVTPLTATSQSHPAIFESFGRATTWDNLNNVINAVNAYSYCEPLSSILNKQAEAFTNAMFTCQTSAGTELRGDKKVYLNLLKYPNNLQTSAQYFSSLFIYVRLFGYCLVWNRKSTMDGLYDLPIVTNSILLPPQFLQIRWKAVIDPFRTVLENIETVHYRSNAKLFEIPVNEIYCITDNTASSHNALLPSSKISALKYHIANIIKAYEAKGVLMDNRGALGLISPNNDSIGAQRLNEEDEKKLQQDYRRFGIMSGQAQMMFSNISVSYQSISTSIKDLALTESIEDDIKSICNALGFPFVLTSQGSNTTFNNQMTAEAAMYANGVIPACNNIMEQYNDMLDADLLGIKYSASFEHITALQESKKDEAARKKNLVAALVEQFTSNGIKYQRYLELLGEPDTTVQDVYFYEMPIEFQNSFRQKGNNNNNQNQANNNDDSSNSNSSN